MIKGILNNLLSHKDMTDELAIEIATVMNYIDRLEKTELFLEEATKSFKGFSEMPELAAEIPTDNMYIVGTDPIEEDNK